MAQMEVNTFSAKLDGKHRGRSDQVVVVNRQHLGFDVSQQPLFILINHLGMQTRDTKEDPVYVNHILYRVGAVVELRHGARRGRQYMSLHGIYS